MNQRLQFTASLLFFLFGAISCSETSSTPPPDTNIGKASNDDRNEGVTSTPPKESNTENAPSPLTLTLNGTEYVHRYSKGALHEFTPPGQNDLQKWSDMLSINVYADAHDGEALAHIANNVLSLYTSHKAIVLRTDSVPRTEDRPAEHLIVVSFCRPEFTEAVQARFLLVGDVGMSVIHSHRVYGQGVGEDMSLWLENNGPGLERALMAWNEIPAPRSLQDLKREPDPG